VGLATLYRQFPTRGDLIEAVYVAEVDALCQDTFRVAAEEDPWPALVAWVRHFITYIATKRVLVDALDREFGTFRGRDALYEFGKPLLTRAQESGYANANLTIHDVLRYIVGVTGAPFGSNARRERILDIAVAGLAAPGVTATYDQRLRRDPQSTAPLSSPRLAHD
jgi:AcrR family transcriptional regulator